MSDSWESPRPLTARTIRRGLRTSILAACMGSAFFAVIAGVPTTMLLERLGATGVQIGLLVTLQQLVMLAQVPAAWWASRSPTRKPLFLTLALPHRILWIVPALLPILFPHLRATIVWILATVSLSALLQQASAPLWLSWMSDLVPERESGRYWGTRQSAATISALIMTALSGLVLDLYRRETELSRSLVGFSLVFGAAVLLGCGELLLHIWIPEPAVEMGRRPDRIGSRLLLPLRDRDLRWLTLALGTWTFALGLVGSFGPVYLKREFDLSYLQLSLLAVSASIGAAIASTLMGVAMDRLGGRAMTAALFWVAPVTAVVWWFLSPQPVRLAWAGREWLIPQPVLALGAMNLLGGMLYSAVGIGHLKLLGLFAPKGPDRTLAIAVHWTLVGLMGAAGPWVGGWIMDHAERFDPGWRLPFGVPWSFYHWILLLHALVCWGLAAPAILRVSRREEEPGLGMALSLLRPGNPLRAVSMLHDMWVAVTAQTSEARARAVRRLGEQRANFAVRDLIRLLDDPSPEVREQAAIALGRIGGDEAIAALIEELRDPRSDVAPAVARALRIARDPRSVEVLLAAMESGDRETAAESARALGEIGDPQAAEALRETLRTTRDPRLATASGEALARLGRIDAIYDMLPRAKSTPNPVLRQTLYVAVGDLFGELGEFYRILLTEREAPGSEVERLLNEIRRWTRDLTEDDALANGIQRQLASIQEAYDAERIPECASALLATARDLLGIRPPPNPPTDDRDRRLADLAAVTLWFLDLLNHHWASVDIGHRDRTDILLGVYALYSLTRAVARHQAGE